MADLPEFVTEILLHARDNGGDFASFDSIDLVQEELAVPVTGEVDNATVIALATAFENNQPGVDHIVINTEDSREEKAELYAVAAPLIGKANELLNISVERSSGEIAFEDGLGNSASLTNKGTPAEGAALTCANGEQLSAEDQTRITEELVEMAKDKSGLWGSVTGASNVLDHDVNAPNPIANACETQASREL